MATTLVDLGDQLIAQLVTDASPHLERVRLIDPTTSKNMSMKPDEARVLAKAILAQWPDGRLSMGWWQSDSKMVSYPASEWEEVKDEGQ